MLNEKIQLEKGFYLDKSLKPTKQYFTVHMDINICRKYKNIQVNYKHKLQQKQEEEKNG